MNSPKVNDFDFIIVGAGSAGSVLANKLSQQGSYSVLLLEQGKSDSSVLLKMPKGFGAVLAGEKYVSRYSVSSNTLRPNDEVWLRGKTLGGSSSVNGMIWARPQPEGFKALTLAGGDKWSWAQINPYLEELDGAANGKGIICVNRHKNQYAITDAFVESSCSTGLKNYDQMPDVGQIGTGYLYFNIDNKGKRHSAATAFLKPISQQSNIRIETTCQVDKILFEGKHASAVMCQGSSGKITYTARREIILCAGTLESPQILQRSGIGPAPLLDKLGIDIVHENPNVGKNLREHLLLGINFQVKSAAYSENSQYAGLRLLWNVIRYGITRNGPMAQSPCHAATFVSSDIQSKTPDIQIMFSPFSREGNGFSKSPGVSIAGYPMFPKSTGEIMISSARPSAPIITPNYLSDEYDRKASIEAIRAIRNIAEQTPLADKLLCELPSTAVAQTDDDIVDLYQKNGQPGFHAVGTCAMGSDSESSVVGSNTSVHGVTGLRVVDCSIYPQMLAGVTNALTMAVAMRAADLIIEEQV